MHEKQVGYRRRGSGLSGSGRPFVSLLSRLASGVVLIRRAVAFSYEGGEWQSPVRDDTDNPEPDGSSVLSSVVLSPLVSSCLGFSALVSSCVVCWASPGPFLGLSRASLGTHFGPQEGYFGLLGSPLAGSGGPWAPLEITLGGSWLSLGPPLVLAASWASFGASWAALDRRKRVFTTPCKKHGFCVVFA